MRLAVALAIALFPALAQFRSTVPLVVAPTTITDAKGRLVDGIDPADLILYDNNVPQTIQVDPEVYPISLVVAIQASVSAIPMLDKLGRSGILFANLVAGDRGETAILTFGDDVRVVQNFTSEADPLERALKSLEGESDRAPMLDAILASLRLLGRRPADRRRVILLISEKRDRGSSVGLDEVALAAQRQNALIYWLTFSPSLIQYTARQKTIHSDDKKIDGTPLPPATGGFNLIAGFIELYRLSKPDSSELFTKITGARAIGFLRRNGLEQAIQAIGDEVHRQYIVTFTPKPGAPGQFHAIRVEVKGRPELTARTRAGYWTAE